VTPRLPLVAIVLGVVPIFGFALLVGLPSATETAGGLLVLPILLVVSIPLLARARRRETEPFFRNLIVFAFLAKLAASIVRYTVAFDIYDKADARVYHEAGLVIAERLRDLQFDLGLTSYTDTNFIRLLTGVIYMLVGSNVIAGFLVFSWIGFWGTYFWYRAFRVALPDGDVRFFAVAVFLLPSMLFWPSSIGKEAWLTLSIGIAALGVARMAVPEGTRGMGIFVVGAAMAAVVRPHIALMLAVPALSAYLVRRASPGSGVLAPVTKMLGIGVIVAATALFVIRLETHQHLGGFTEGSLSLQSLESALDQTTLQTTTQTGSGISAPGGNWLVRIPMSIVTVLFRPFLFEAHNVTSLVASLETTLIGLMILLRFRNLGSGLRVLRRRPFVMFCALYALVFTVAFGSFGNLGLLARQRVQVLPAVFLLLAVPKRERPSPRRLTPLRQEPLRGTQAELNRLMSRR
jgi:hypothetical protein